MSRFLSSRLSALEAYTPGEQPQDMAYIKLNTNESPFPPSPGVLAALNGQEAARLNLYPDPAGAGLVERLAQHYGVNPENVFLGNGSDEILSFAFMAFCDGERHVAFPDISYGFYPVYAQLYGIPAQVIPLAEDLSIRAEDYCGLQKNIVIANPNAPTGLCLTRSEIERILRTNPGYVVLVDEAYVDFGGESCAQLINRYDNLLVVQTYSKSRSMAGARLGFALGEKALIEDLNRIKFSINPYNINRLTLVAGEVALEEQDYYDARCKNIMENRTYATKELRRRGFFVTDSRANFLFARHPVLLGRELYSKLKKLGILIRHFNKPRISDYVRITVGTREQMDALLRAIDQLLA